MTIISARTYRDGQLLADGEAAVIGTDAPPLRPGEFAWVGLHEPDPAELAACARRFAFHPLAVEDAMHTHELPKLEVFGDQLFIVARTAAMKNGRITYGETAIFVGPGHIVTVRHGSDHGHSALRARLEERSQLLAHGVDYVVHELLDMVVDNYVPVIDAIALVVAELETDALESSLSRDRMRDLFNLRRDLLHFQRVLIPLEEVCAKLASIDIPHIDIEVRPYFRDVLDHVRRVASLAGLYREVLNSVMETSALIAQQHQSNITRQLAAWAAILAVPTAIAGIYGMNFEHMPELRIRYAYFIVLGVIALVCTGLYIRFRRMDWL